MKKIAVIVLAAGQSSRMGVSKQLVVIEGTTLLERILDIINHLKEVEVVVVLGANAEAHRPIVRQYNFCIVFNASWLNGLGGSVKAGLSYVTECLPEVEGVLFVLCDQPALTTSHLQTIIDCCKRTQSTIITSGYNKTEGVPAFFHRTHFAELFQLDDSEGARKVIARCSPDSKTIIPFPGGEIDLDTPEDLERYLHKKSRPE